MLELHKNGWDTRGSHVQGKNNVWRRCLFTLVLETRLFQGKGCKNCFKVVSSNCDDLHCIYLRWLFVVNTSLTGNIEKELPRWSVGRLSVDCRPTVGRQTATNCHSQPTNGFLPLHASFLTGANAPKKERRGRSSAEDDQGHFKFLLPVKARRKGRIN